MILSKILFTPLDIPRLMFRHKQQILDLYHEYAADINKPSNPNFPTVWKGIICYKSGNFVEDNLLHKGYHLDLSGYLIDEIQILENFLPIELESISLWTNVRHVNAHVDKKIYDTKFDFRFRFILAQDQDSFFIQHEDQNRYIKMPTLTNVFCFNNQECKHGGTYRPDNHKVLGIIRGKIIDNKKLQELVDQSIETYRDYVIFSDDLLDKIN